MLKSESPNLLLDDNNQRVESNGCSALHFCSTNGCVNATEGLVKLRIDGAWQKYDLLGAFAWVAVDDRGVDLGHDRGKGSNVVSCLQQWQKPRPVWKIFDGVRTRDFLVLRCLLTDCF